MSTNSRPRSGPSLRPVLRLIFTALLGIFVLPPAPLFAQAPAPLVVGTREAPPFAMQNSEGEWSGISIDLWREAARQLDLEFEFRPMPTPESLVQGVADGALDASVAAITVTAARAEQVDFTQPFFSSGLGIVVPATAESGWWRLLRGFFPRRFCRWSER